MDVREFGDGCGLSVGFRDEQTNLCKMKPVWIGSKVLLDSRDIKKAAIVQFVEIPPLLQLDLTEVGGKKWMEMTRQLDGKQFAIFFDGELYSVFGVRDDSFSQGPPTVAHIDVQQLSVGKLWKVVSTLNKEIAERNRSQASEP